MYARIVLSSVESMDDVDSIKDSLRTFPEDLDEAYDRVFRRICSLRPPVRAEKAQRLLGWVGCSPCTMTKQELEALLLIRENDFDGCNGVISETQAIKDCGPLLEVLDDYVQFVHFTVKEYIFSTHIQNNPINMDESRLQLAKCCIQYLCQRHHDVNLPSGEVERLIATGVYRLDDYAVSMWLPLLELCLKARPSCEDDLSSLLRRLMNTRGNDKFHQDDDLERASTDTFKSFNKRDPELVKFLARASIFREKWTDNKFEKRQVRTWLNLDPTTITTTSKSVWFATEHVLCGTVAHKESCLCRQVLWHFGSRPFKCSLLGCDFGRHGFSSKQLRDKHQKYHDRAWKCSQPDCQFSRGFLSVAMRDKHWELCHTEKAKDGVTDLDFGDDDSLSLVTDIVKDDNLAMFDMILPRILQVLEKQATMEMSYIGRRSQLEAMMEISNTIGRHGSIPIITALRDHARHVFGDEISGFHYGNSYLDHYKRELLVDTPLLQGIIRADNVETFRHLTVLRDFTARLGGCLVDVFQSANKEIRSAWEQLLDIEQCLRTPCE
jgi:hypothetical protein